MTFDQRDIHIKETRYERHGGRQKARLALLFLDQIKREKGVWWMPRQ